MKPVHPKERNIKFYYNHHLAEIKKTDYDVLFLNSTQGTSKSTSMRKDFTEQKDARFIKESRSSLEKQWQLIQKETGSKKAYIIKTLEDICITYKNAEKSQKGDYVPPLISKVKRYREIGFPPDKIHKFICKDKECGYPERNKSINGLSMLSFNAFLIRIQHNKETGGKLLGNPLRIYFDEADPFLKSKKIKFKDYRIFDKLVNARSEILADNAFIKTSYIHDPALLKELQNDFNEKSKTESDIDEWEYNLEDLQNAIKILQFGYISGFDIKKMAVEMSPQIVPLFRYVLESDVPMVCGSAILGKDLIQQEQIRQYFYTIRESVEMNLYEKLEMDGDNTDPSHIKKLNNAVRISDAEIKFYKAPPPLGITQLYLHSVRNHSFSHNRHKYNSKNREDRKSERDFYTSRRLEMQETIEEALNKMEVLYQMQLHDKKTLVITFKEIAEYIRELKRSWKKNSLSPLFDYDFLAWFSGDMHGMNAPDKGYELIILYGDPINHSISRFCHSLKLIPEQKQKLLRGFTLKDETDINLREMIMRSAISEILEGVHRSRGNMIPSDILTITPKIPVLAISNLLSPDSEIDKRIVSEVLKEDRIELHDMNIEDDEYRKKRREKIKIQMESLLDDMGLEFGNSKLPV